MLLPGYLRGLLFKPEDGSYTIRRKCRRDSTGLHGVTCQKMVLIIVTWTNTRTSVQPLRMFLEHWFVFRVQRGPGLNG
jgi:hypothetical protein